MYTALGMVGYPKDPSRGVGCPGQSKNLWRQTTRMSGYIEKLKPEDG